MTHVITKSNTKVYYHLNGHGPTALIFAHGWCGHSEWWDSQRDYFKDRYTVVQMDMPGHGLSDLPPGELTSRDYAEAIITVGKSLAQDHIILVGHSMSGAYVMEAAPHLPNVKGIVLVDTLKDLDQVFTFEMADKMLFDQYRKDFKYAVEHMMSPFLFSPATPQSIKEKIEGEIVAKGAEMGIKLLAPLYKMDIHAIARHVKIPVRAINADYTPTNPENNRKYIEDYEYDIIEGCGHYPMLEKPEEFNRILERILGSTLSTHAFVDDLKK